MKDYYDGHAELDHKIIVFRNFDKEVHPWEGGNDLEKFGNFTKNLFTLLVTEYEPVTAIDIFEHNRTMIALFRNEKDDEAPFMKVYEESASVYRHQMFFVRSWYPIKPTLYHQEVFAKYNNISDEVEPTLIIFEPNGWSKYRYPGRVRDITFEQIEGFIKDF